MSNKNNKSHLKAVPTSTELFDSVTRLNRNMKRCAAISVSNSFGHGRGRVLKMIAAHNGINARRLADLLDIRPPSLTSRLKPLMEDGLILKERDPDDARVVRIYITDKGRSALKEREKAKKNTEVDYCGCLSDKEKKQLIDLCNRLSDHLAKCRNEYDQKLKEAIANLRIS